MSSPIKRPFKIWSKSKRLNPNLTRFNQFITSSEAPAFLEYFFLTNLRPIKLSRRVIVRTTQYAYLSKATIEAFRKVIAPHFRKKAKGFSKFYIRCYPHLPLMKKPAEVRMGGGKGNKLRGFFCPVVPGQILFELTFKPLPWSIKLLRYASKKLNMRVSISYVLFPTHMGYSYIGNGAKLSVIDNSGVKKLKNIIVYDRHSGGVGDLGIGSLFSVKPRRKLKKGNLTRFLLIQSRKQVCRPIGSYVRSLAFRAILIKRTEFEPIANRLNGFFFIDLRKYEEFRSTGLTVYIV